MPIRIVQLGTARAPGEGLRLGTVRRPPRGVPKSEFARRDFYDLWLPQLAPSAQGVAAAQRAAQLAAQGGDTKAWAAFERSFAKEMAEGDAGRLLDLLAALSRQTSFSLGCYCADERRCHRGVLRSLLAARGAQIVD